MKIRIPPEFPERIRTILTAEPWLASNEPFGFDRQGLEEVASYLSSPDSQDADLGTLPLWHYLTNIYDEQGIKDQICQAILTNHPGHFRLIATLIPDLSDDMLNTVVEHFLNHPDLWTNRFLYVIENIADWGTRVLHPHLVALHDVLREVNRYYNDEYEFGDVEAALGGAPDEWVERYERSRNIRYLGRIRTPSAREALLRLLGRPDAVPRDQQWLIDWVPVYNGMLLDEQGASLLVFPKAYRGIIAGAGYSPHQVGISINTFHCQRCHTSALLLLDLNVISLDLGHEIRGATHIPMLTCECSDTVQARVVDDRIELLGDRWQVRAAGPDRTHEQSLHLIPHRNQWGVDNVGPHANHQVGGFPAWEQSPEYPACPGCGKTMLFVAQIDSGDNMGHCFWGDGMCYVFWCNDCATATTLYQQG